jgi:hypothetical protein
MSSEVQVGCRRKICSLLSAGFSLGLRFDTEDGDDIFLRNVGLSELHGVTTQKTALFKNYIVFLSVHESLVFSPGQK